MSQQNRFLCGVPNEECTGGILHSDQTFKTHKCHSSRKEALKCKGRYLQKQGYVKLSSRTFQLGDGPILILPKQSKFGGRLRRGKSEKGTGASRFEPMRGAGLIY